MARRELTDIPGRGLPSGGELTEIAAGLAAEDEQAGNPGLRATFALEHKGEEAISLLNPFEMLQWQLLDERGAPLALRQRPPSLLVIGEQAGSWTDEGPLRVVEAHRGGEALATTALDTPVVILGSGEHMAATFELELLADGRRLAEGSYAIGCVATLIDADHPDRSRILRAEPIRVGFRPSRAS